jgi:hypothetical protein
MINLQSLRNISLNKENDVKHTVHIEEDPETGDLVLPLPTELLNQMGWDIGDDLVWTDNFNGTFSLSKKVDNEQEKAYNKDNDNSN